MHGPYKINDVRLASKRQLFTVISMFAGGGGSSVGYGLAGGRVLMANEFVPEAARTYRANFPDTILDTRDIRDITVDDAAMQSFLDKARLAPGELDVLDGSVPCNEFSRVGPGIRDQRTLLPYSDVKQRGSATLIFDFAKLTHFALPKVFIIENVPGMAGAQDLFENALDALRFGKGTNNRLYYVSHKVLKAEDYGVPQRRHRLFIVGIHEDVAKAAGVFDDAGVSKVFPAVTHDPVSVRAALAGLRQEEAEIYPWRRAMMVSSLGRVVRLLPRNSDKCMGPKDAGWRANFRFTLRRCAWNLPAPTITASGQHPDGRSGLVHPEEDRKFTIPELKRLTSLPDDFALTGTLAQRAERIGQMVPPLLTKAVAESVYERVLLPYAEERERLMKSAS